jgi:hypothetical protein
MKWMLKGAPGRLGDPDPGSFHRRFGSCQGEKTNPQVDPGGEAFGPSRLRVRPLLLVFV